MTLRITSKPARAYVYRRGSERVLGKTPFTTQIERADHPVHFELRLRGHYHRAVQLSASQDGSRSVVMKKRARAGKKSKKSRKRKTDVPDIVF